MQVLKTDEDDSVARLTVSIGDDDHRFEISAQGDTAVVEYEETLTWRGAIEVSEPDDDIWLNVMASEAVTEFLDTHDCQSVKRIGQKV